jgi:hypothetical protein
MVEDDLQPRKIEYWSCHRAKHRHATYSEALHCIQAKIGREQRRKAQEDRKAKQDLEVLLRRERILELRAQGMNFTEIGKELGLSGARVRDIHEYVVRQVERRIYREIIPEEELKFPRGEASIVLRDPKSPYLLDLFRRYVLQSSI